MQRKPVFTWECGECTLCILLVTRVVDAGLVSTEDEAAVPGSSGMVTSEDGEDGASGVPALPFGQLLSLR